MGEPGGRSSCHRRAPRNGRRCPEADGRGRCELAWARGSQIWTARTSPHSGPTRSSGARVTVGEVTAAHALGSGPSQSSARSASQTAGTPGPSAGAAISATARAQSATVGGESLAAGAAAPRFPSPTGSGPRHAGAAGRASCAGCLSGGLGMLGSSASSPPGSRSRTRPRAAGSGRP
eukprot:15453205-Alexandrium_andersonii.AAC.1